MKDFLYALCLLSLLSACGRESATGERLDIDAIAAEYLFLELSMGRHDAGHVDAYFGPPDVRARADAAELPLVEIARRTDEMKSALLAEKEALAAIADTDAMTLARVDGLAGRLVALETRLLLNQGQTLPFDEESRRLFGTAAPDYDADHFAAILAEIDALLAGDGDLPARVNAFRDRFVIPPDRLAAVFDAAIAECRRRTLEHIALPENESFTIEYVTDKPWSGYNWYQGDARSLIQINTDLPIYISRAVDLGCHEGYPGHHTFNALLEAHLVEGRGWMEFSLYPLYSPQSLIAEGSGNYGIELAFPDDQRTRFEKSVLFPLAGLDPAEADRYYELLALLDKLEYAGNEAARDYLNGVIDRDAAVQWLVTYALSSRERADQRVDFFDTYRSYVINYNLGQDLVRQYVERDGGDSERRWNRFEILLSSPMTAADLL